MEELFSAYGDDANEDDDKEHREEEKKKQSQTCPGSEVVVSRGGGDVNEPPSEVSVVSGASSRSDAANAVAAVWNNAMTFDHSYYGDYDSRVVRLSVYGTATTAGYSGFSPFISSKTPHVEGRYISKRERKLLEEQQQQLQLHQQYQQQQPPITSVSYDDPVGSREKKQKWVDQNEYATKRRCKVIENNHLPSHLHLRFQHSAEVNRVRWSTDGLCSS